MSELNFIQLMQYVRDYGFKKEIFGHQDRHLISTFGNHIRFNLQEGCPIITTRKTPWKHSINEMLWYIEGTGDCAALRRDYKVVVWDLWAVNYHNKKYNTSYTVKEWQELVDNGSITEEKLPLHYTNMTNKKVYNYSLDTVCSLDQTRWLLDGMRKTPFRKSFHVDMWQAETVYQMADECGNESVELPACWHSHTVNYLDGKLNLHVSGRSWDIWTAGAWNICQYAALCHMYAHCLKLPVGEIYFSTTDTHLYSNLLEQTNEQITRTPYQLPTLNIRDRGQKYLQDFNIDDFEVVGYKCHPTLKGEITVVGGY